MSSKTKKPTPRPKSRQAPSEPVKSASKPGKTTSVKSAKPAAKAPSKIAPKAAKAPAKPAPKAVKAAAKPLAKPVPAKPSKAAPVVKATKSAPAKPAPKPVKPAGKALASAKPVAKIAPKVAPKATKPAAKPAKPVSKAAPATKVVKVSKPAAKPVAKVVKAASKPVPAAKPVKAAPAPKIVAKPAKPAPEPKPAAKPAKAPEAKAKPAKLELHTGPFFQEVVPGSPAARKTRVPQVASAPLKKPKGEESHDELIARIERELLTVRMVTRKVQRAQICTKCCINPVEPGYMVDRDTGYCAECAIVLGLGHTREARQQNFHPSLMKSEEEEAFED